MDKDKRHQPRIKLKQTISAADDSTMFLIDIIDISAEGICFTSEVEYKKGDRIYLVFPGNKQIKENELEASVWRCEPAGNSTKLFKVTAVFVDANLKYLYDINKLNEET